MTARLDLKGQRFGRLVAIKRLGNKITPRGNYMSVWACLCDCGKKSNVTLINLRNGSTKSCGCLTKEISSKLFTKHGFSSNRNRRVFSTDYRFYSIFKGLKNRCNNPNNSAFVNYGKRGIKVLWPSFESFKKDMYPSYLQHVKAHGVKNTTIDRINNDGHYSKVNCKWATLLEQSRNRRPRRKTK